ncbi:MAG: radical SAM protein [Desulfovibrio sp.]
MNAPARLSTTKKRSLTRRGVVWLGQTCNLRCRFCYFQTRIEARDHPEHPFMSLEKATAIVDTLRGHYDNRAIDIQGGEPTIFPGIERLCEHCANIGLTPTLITNGLALANRQACRRLADAGVRDLLVSVHGLGDSYDDVVGVPGAHKKQMDALSNCLAVGLPVRFNCVLTRSALPQLGDVAGLAADVGARVVNFIAFNPFEDQQTGERSRKDVPAYGEVTPPLVAALDSLERAGIEANVRYFPLCQLPDAYRKNIYDFQQLPYDSHEWDYASWSWTDMKPQRMRDGELSPLIGLREANLRSPLYRAIPAEVSERFTTEELYRENARIRAVEHCGYRYAPACEACGARGVCDGFHGDYASFFGFGEATPIVTPAPITDPKHYIDAQDKIVD